MWALENRREFDATLREHGHDPRWTKCTRTDEETGKKVFTEFRGVCRNCGGDILIGWSWSSSTSHATRNIRDNDCSGPGTAWQTEMVHELMHKRFAEAVSGYVQALNDVSDREWLREVGIQA